MENKELCSKCKGLCCKSCGCHYSPNDFKNITFESLKTEIEKGHISIDWWNGSPFDDKEHKNIDKVYYLRIRNVDSNIVDPSFGDRCSLLTETGCSLTYNERPMGGKMLIPNENGCEQEYDKQQSAIDWYEYNDILKELVELYRDPNEIDFGDILGFFEILKHLK